MCTFIIYYLLITPQFILPCNLDLKAETIYCEPGVLNIHTSVCQTHSACPICGKSSTRIHSRYYRTLLYLPISGHLARVKLRARKYFCDNSICHRKVFTERFDYEILRYYRRMLRSNALFTRMALELGGNTGAAISRYVGVPVSPATILRVIKKIDLQPKELTSGVIGVDDWALKKGKTYGTVIVDLERKEVIDLLPDRESGTLSKWLKKHPEIQTVSRDRYGPYALGIKKGAPHASQVADRFHLLMNLGEATKRIFQSKGKELREVFTLYNDSSSKASKLVEIEHAAEIRSSTVDPHISTANISIDKQHKFDKVKELHSQGITLRKIARITKLARGTVRRYVIMERLEKRQSRSSTNMEAFIGFLFQDDNRGKTYRELHKLIVEMGFNGKYTQFCFKMNEIYERQPCVRIQSPAPITIKTWSPTRLSIMLYMESEQLQRNEDRDFLKLLFEKLHK